MQKQPILFINVQIENPISCSQCLHYSLSNPVVANHPLVGAYRSLLLRAAIKTTYFLGHGSPYPVAFFVPVYIVSLCKQEEKNAKDVDCQKNSISTSVFWLVVSTVDVIPKDIAKLDTH